MSDLDRLPLGHSQPSANVTGGNDGDFLVPAPTGVSIMQSSSSLSRAAAPSPDQSVREIVNLYLAMESGPRARRVRQDRGKAEARAWDQIERVVRAFRDRYGDLPVSQCIKARLREFIEDRGGSDGGKHSLWGIIQRVFNWAADEMELIARNPFKGRCPYKKGKPRRAMTEEEFQRLLVAANPQFALLLRFCRLTGARPGELRTAHWDDIEGSLDWAAWLVLEKHKTVEKTGRPRIVALPPAAADLLIDLKKARGDAGLIFHNTRGQGWTRNALTLQMRRLREKLGIAEDCKLYCLRHKFATDAIVNGCGIKDVADLLGHTTTRMAEHYVHTAGMHTRLCHLAGKANGPEKPDDEPPAAIC
jgi:integrase